MKIKDAVLIQHSTWPLALQVIQKLKKAGFNAVLAGGCVRDLILKRIPKDLDVATEATPAEVEALFEKTVAVGKAFGVIRVLHGSREIEVASFRFDGEYVDGRRPASVRFASLEEDAQRRDFTMNALFYDPETGEILDGVGGVADIELRLIRCVGIPVQRFKEDHLRLIRALRFSAELGFTIEPATWSAIVSLAPLIKSVSHERLRDELFKIMKSQDPTRGFRLLQESGILAAIDVDLAANLQSGSQLLGIQLPDFARLSHHAKSDLEAKLWVLFFSLYGAKVRDAKVLAQKIVMFRLSRECQKFIQNSFSYFFSLAQISQWSLGKLLRIYAEPEFRWALEMAEQYQSPPQSLFWVQNLRNEVAVRGLDLRYPERLVKGHDVPDNIQIERRKEFLDMAYEEQLLGGWTLREEALEWMQTHKK